ncbi:hypothetical protein [Ferviditalea candida]|uniref:Methyl-accepting chemotaxis protein n=1 Tax=Ferviditalea candida TaxID=3108399 RepID=A0ABU5ZIX0_9BACL|nr:hypothetical protein [Paenibacillaceae bacterium T2]
MEAARAEEQGKGFGILANEVKQISGAIRRSLLRH